MAELPKELEQQIAGIVESEGLELVHIELRPQGRRYLLRIDIDKNDGVTLDDCQLVSHQVSALLDVEDPIPAAYELEVSSPGLDRKFYRESDYRKFLGRMVRVKTSRAIGGLHVIIGRLEEYDGERIVVVDPSSKKGISYEVPMSEIREARLEVEL
ncbi:MAG TPA: ribosome maturation factor RimP [Thermoanaerobaculia bacterium]|nr:ribosome maturation factor RimP [Thermoanaerobaculia bacterium]